MFQTTNQWFNDIFNDSLKVWEGCHEKIPKRQMCDLMGQKSYVPQPEITLCHQLLPNGDHLTPPNSTPSDGTDPVPRWNIWSQDWMRNIAGKTQRKWVVKSIGWHDAGFFSECVARVPVSLWGSGGWGCVRSTLRLWSQPFATVRNRSQPSATVRNRSREDRMAVPMGSSAGGVIFGGFQRFVASFRVAGVALRDIQRCFVTCRKSFCVAGAILLRRVQKMCCSFRGRRSTLDVSIVIFRGRRSTLDVSCCVFFVNRIGRAASSGDKVQIPWQAWHFVRCAENWRKPRTKHRFWGPVLRKTRRKTSILKLESGENWRKSRTKCSFRCSHLSRLESLVFL